VCSSPRIASKRAIGIPTATGLSGSADGGEIASDYDGDLLDRVNVLCREVGPFRNPTAQEMEGLGFSPVGESAKRFSPEDGYYTA